MAICGGCNNQRKLEHKSMCKITALYFGFKSNRNNLTSLEVNVGHHIWLTMFEYCCKLYSNNTHPQAISSGSFKADLTKSNFTYSGGINSSFLYKSNTYIPPSIISPTWRRLSYNDNTIKDMSKEITLVAVKNGAVHVYKFS